MQYLRIDPFWYNGVRAKANLATLGRAAYGKRKAETTSRKDLLSFMLNIKDPDTGLPLPGDEVLAEAISFIVGGSDTTASTMSSVMDFVSRDPECQNELFDELSGIFPGPLDDEWVADEELASKSALLNAMIKETLRLRPTSSTGLERIVPAGGRNIAGNFYPENVSYHRSVVLRY
jgi:benzoate 4-monooxygenase